MMAHVKDAYGKERVPARSYTPPAKTSSGGGAPVYRPSTPSGGSNAGTPAPTYRPSAPSGGSSAGAAPASPPSPAQPYSPPSTHADIIEQRAEQFRITSAARAAQMREALANKRVARQQALEDREATKSAPLSTADSSQTEQLAALLKKIDNSRASSRGYSSSEPFTPKPYVSLRDRLEMEKELEERRREAFLNQLNDKQQALLPLLSRLPEDFPARDWDTMHPKKQLAIMQKTNLSHEEQWLFLNAAPSIRTLMDVWKLQENGPANGLTDAQLNRLTERLLSIGNERLGTQTHQIQFGSERMRNNYLRYLDEKEEEAFGEVLGRIAVGRKSSDGIGEEREGWYNAAKDTADAIMTSAPLSTPVPVSGQAPVPRGNGEKAYVFYTNSPGAAYEAQAKYYRNYLHKSGYDAEAICIDNVTQFMDEWKDMDPKTGAAVIISHCNGMSLIFGEPRETNAISATGKNIQGLPIPAIGDLEGPGASVLYLYACNAAHEELLAKEGTNVADAFRDLPKVSMVYAFDGSVGFGLPGVREALGAYPGRLSGDQGGYYEVYEKFKIPGEPGKPSGQFLYEDE